MKRLTKKISGFVPNNAQNYRNSENITHNEIVNKLGQLEDIEERLQKYKEFGINDLVSLFSKLNDEDIERFVLMTFKKERIISQKIFPNSNLQQYRQIEEELGIDLITLFKAMKNGIWSKGGFYDDKISETPTFIARPEISLCSFYEEVNDNYETIKREENVWCIYTYDFELQIRQTMLKDYGKTWALTKEELEE